MTEAAFIFMHTNSIVNASTRLNINITAVDPVPNGEATSIVIGQNAFSVNGDVINTDLNNVLEQVEKIKFTFQITGEDDIVFNEEITNRAYYGATVSNGNPFFYFQFTPIIIRDIDSAPFVTELFEYQPIQISLTPYLLDITFGFSEYNATIGNAQKNRKSKLRVESNRTEDSTLPTNWDAIISGSAFPATIQDSSYSDTGWIRARYNGTSINSRGNAGVSPSFTGTPFQGEVFSSDTDNSYICSTNRKVRDILELLHTSTTPLPSFSSSSLGTTITSSSMNDTTSGVTLIQPPTTGSIEIGSILLIANSSQLVAPGYELFLVNKTKQLGGGIINVTVQRGYGDTPVTGHDALAPVFIVNPFDIFEFEQERLRYIKLISNSKIYVQGNNTVVDTDDFGNIINQTLCEYVEYIVTD
tara:strand:+ start:8045 stop:9289 length:1245 start_codon:yes stop_codon:yes gene_type:complete